jgi:peptidase MA superfamily protein
MSCFARSWINRARILLSPVFIAVVLTVLLAVPIPIQAESKVPTLETEHFVFWSAPEDEFMVGRLAETEPDEISALEWDCLTKLNFKVKIVIAPNRDTWEYYAGKEMPDWVAAYAMPSRRLIVFRSWRWGPKYNLTRTLRHEYIHIINGVTGQGKIPLWFDEGMAGYYAPNWGLGTSTSFLMSGFLDTFYKFSQLEETFPRSRDDAELAYAQSASFIGYLANLYGKSDLKKVMRLSAEYSSFDKAFVTVYGSTVPTQTQTWKKQFRKHSTWIVVATSSGTLWFLILITFIIVYIIKSRQTRRILQEWESQEWFEREFQVLDDGTPEEDEESFWEDNDETENY